MAVVNGRQLATGLRGGITRYTTEVLASLPPMELIGPPTTLASGSLGHLWEQTVLPARLRGRSLWSPANFGPLLVERQALTIYDTSPIDHPEWFGRTYSELFRTLVPRVASRAAAVMTISEFSRDRIATVMEIDAERIVVAPPGVGSPFIDRVDPALERTTDIVVLAGPDPRKNLAKVLAAWSAVAASLPDHRLVVITGRRASSVFGAVADVTDEPRVSVVADPTDAELVARLRAAAAAVFVPLYEGFGLPAVEAVACGTPLVTSDIPPIREAVGASGALIVDPTDTAAIAGAITAAVRTPTPTTPGSVERYRWSETGRIVASVLGELDG